MQDLVYTLYDNDTLDLKDIENKVIINVEANSKVKIKELLTSKCEIVLNVGNNSNVKYNIVSLNSLDIKRDINVSNNAYMDIEAIMLNKVIDTTIINLIGENSNVSYKNLGVSNNNSQTINTKIIHLNNSTISTINNIGVAFDGANILFNTEGSVKNGFKKCDCRQLSKGIIIGEKSKITSRPILLIDEFDVQAYHGATIGKMSDDELFYLMSRGLSKKESFLLILNGLIEPFLNNISDDLLKNDIKNNISSLIGE